MGKGVVVRRVPVGTPKQAETSWVDTGLSAANDFCQAFVDMIPFGRTVVDGALGLEHWVLGTHVDAAANKGSWAYTAGTVGGLGWGAAMGSACLAKLVAGAPRMAASQIKFVAYLGNAVQGTRTIKNIDNARKFMEFTRASMYLMKLWFNQKRLNAGKISKEQFESMLNNDRWNYQMGATLWAMPGTAGLWIAAGSMAIGNILNQMNLETMSQGNSTGGQPPGRPPGNPAFGQVDPNPLPPTTLITKPPVAMGR